MSSYHAATIDRPFYTRVLRDSSARIVAITIALKIALMVFATVVGFYGYHRDELLYAAMGDHLAWGYLEVPPLIAGFAWLSQLFPGDSLLALRFFPMLFAAGIVVLTGSMVREMGGERTATLLAMLCMLIAPVFLLGNYYFQPVVFDQFFWVMGAWIVLRILNGADQKYWLLFGAVTGIGLLNKHSILLFGFGVFVGLLLTWHRRELRTPWPWLGALLAFVIASPHIAWQAAHGWPLFEHMRALSQTQLAYHNRVDLLLEHVLDLHPFTAPIWMLGLVYLFFASGGRYRVLAWTFVASFSVLMIMKGKAYYLAGAYPMLIAGGSVFAEGLLRSRAGRVAIPAIATALVVGGIVLLPFALPVVPPAALEQYMKLLGVEHIAGRAEQGVIERIPQDYSDMLGWRGRVADVAAVADRLDPSEREQLVVIANNYGQAGALARFSDQFSLPYPISTNSSFYLWGPGDRPGNVAVTLGIDLDDLLPYFAHCDLAAVTTHPYARYFERDRPIMICREPYRSLQEVWPELTASR